MAGVTDVPQDDTVLILPHERKELISLSSYLITSSLYINFGYGLDVFKYKYIIR